LVSADVAVLHVLAEEGAATVARRAVPSRNWTEPVGCPAGDVTVQERVADAPGAEGFGVVASDADVAAAWTVWFALIALPFAAKLGEPS
jgi:hypothetical protein